jgi:hypothetical protein
MQFLLGIARILCTLFSKTLMRLRIFHIHKVPKVASFYRMAPLNLEKVAGLLLYNISLTAHVLTKDLEGPLYLELIPMYRPLLYPLQFSHCLFSFLLIVFSFSPSHSPISPPGPPRHNFTASSARTFKQHCTELAQ